MSHRKHRADLLTIGDLAPSILAFLAADAGRLDRFLAVTGLNVADLRKLSQDSGFAENLLDYIGSDEAMLCAYAAESGFAPAEIEAVRLANLAPPFDG